MPVHALVVAVERPRVQPRVPGDVAERARVDAAMPAGPLASPSACGQPSEACPAAPHAAGRAARSPRACTRGHLALLHVSATRAKAASSAHTDSPPRKRRRRAATSGGTNEVAVSCECVWSSDAPEPGPSLTEHSSERRPAAACVCARIAHASHMRSISGRESSANAVTWGRRVDDDLVQRRRAGRVPGTGSARRARPSARRRAASTSVAGGV